MFMDLVEPLLLSDALFAEMKKSADMNERFRWIYGRMHFAVINSSKMVGAECISAELE